MSWCAGAVVPWMVVVVAVAVALLVARVNGEDDVNEAGKGPVRVAVIGSGVGGAFAAHHLHHLFKAAGDGDGQTVSIDVFEREPQVGGRLKHFVHRGKEAVEMGGSIIHRENQYMWNFTDALGLHPKHSAYGEHSVLGVFDGDRITFQTSDYDWVTMAKMLIRYGLSPYYMDRIVQDLLTKFNGIYDAQAKNMAFDTVEALLTHVDLYDLTQRNLSSYLKEQGINSLLADELVAGIMRTNYGQDLGMNAFGGAVSLAGASEHLWAIEEGNAKLCERLLDVPSVSLHLNTRTTRIETHPDGKPRVTTANEDGTATSAYDAVVIAAPLETSNIELSADLQAKVVPREMHTTVATFAEGTLNSSYFSIKEDHRPPAIILTVDKDDIPISCIGNVAMDETRQNSVGLFKIFSRQRLTRDELNLFLTDIKDESIRDVEWKAYPKFSPPERFTPFALGGAVVYNNAIENSASAMEMSAIAAKNSALLLAERFGVVAPPPQQAEEEKEKAHTEEGPEEEEEEEEEEEGAGATAVEEQQASVEEKEAATRDGNGGSGGEQEKEKGEEEEETEEEQGREEEDAGAAAAPNDMVHEGGEGQEAQQGEKQKEKEKEGETEVHPAKEADGEEEEEEEEKTGAGAIGGRPHEHPPHPAHFSDPETGRVSEGMRRYTATANADAADVQSADGPDDEAEAAENGGRGKSETRNDNAPGQDEKEQGEEQGSQRGNSISEDAHDIPVIPQPTMRRRPLH